MSDPYWLTEEQMARLQPYFPKSHGKPRVDDRRVLSGIVFVNRNGLRWRDAPKDYGPHKTLYNRWKRWGERGVFLRMMEGLASAEAEPKTASPYACSPASVDRSLTCLAVSSVAAGSGMRSPPDSAPSHPVPKASSPSTCGSTHCRSSPQHNE